MGFKRNFKRRVARERAEAERQKAFEDDLTFIETVERKSKERMARTGERPRQALLGIDHRNRKIKIVPVDPPAERPDGGGDAA